MMGNPPSNLHSSFDLVVLDDNSPSEPLSIKAWECQEAMRRSQQRKLRRKNCSILGYNRRPRTWTKRRALLRISRRPAGGSERGVKALQNLVPAGEYMSLDELFRRTADYIVCLEMQVKVMQVMVEVLTDSSK